MNLKKKQKAIKKATREYRMTRNEIVRFLREDVGLTFSEIGQELTKTKQWAHQLYKQAKKNPYNHALKCQFCGGKEDLKVVDYEDNMGVSSKLLCKKCR